MSGPLEPDRDQLEKFLDALLRYRGEDGYLSMRAFLHDNKPLNSNLWTVRLGARTGSRHVLDVAFDVAYRAANHPQPAVLCPPIAVFNNMDGFKAGEADLYRGLAISVECDQHPLEAQAKLQGILGQPTAVVRSGGSGIAEDRRHLHWRLKTPAMGEDLKKLKRARALATAIVGGDPSNVPAVHCLRWPGSWHRKATPRLCEFIHYAPEREIDLDEALKLLEAEAPPFGRSNGDGEETYSSEFVDLQELIRRIKTGEALHASVRIIAGKYAHQKHPIQTCFDLVGAAFTLAGQERYGGRWDECVRLIRWVYHKEAENQQQANPTLTLTYGWDTTKPQSTNTIVRGLLHAYSLTLNYGPPNPANRSGSSHSFSPSLTATRSSQDTQSHAQVRCCMSPAKVTPGSGNASRQRRSTEVGTKTHSRKISSSPRADRN